MPCHGPHSWHVAESLPNPMKHNSGFQTLPAGSNSNRRFQRWLLPLGVLVIFALALGGVNPSRSLAQNEETTAEEGQGEEQEVLDEQEEPQESSAFQSGLFSGAGELFNEDGQIKLLVLALNPFGISEGPARSIGKILQKNLANTGHFQVVGPDETEAVIERDLPDEDDCRDIACGVRIGKHIGADFVLVGLLQYEDPLFTLQLRMIDISNNLTDYEEEIRYTDETMGEDLFRLSNNISRNSLLGGRVLNTSIRGIVISLGRVHGIKIGDNMVIYKQEVPITNLEGEKIDTQRKNVAVVNVLNVNRNSSEAIIIHKTEDPQVGYFVHTYLDPQRQIKLTENTRRELDTGIRLANRIRPVELAPVLVADMARKEWEDEMIEAEEDQKFWLWVGIGGASFTTYTLFNYSNSTSSQIQLLAAGGVTGYAAWKWFSARQKVNELNLEGRARGFVNLDVEPIFSPEMTGLRISYRF